MKPILTSRQKDTIFVGIFCVVALLVVLQLLAPDRDHERGHGRGPLGRLAGGRWLSVREPVATPPAGIPPGART